MMVGRQLLTPIHPSVSVKSHKSATNSNVGLVGGGLKLTSDNQKLANLNGLVSVNAIDPTLQSLVD
jgi:hypothetical protein